MAVNPGYAQSMMGQWVDAHSVYGVHSGILHQVRPDGIVLAMPRGTVASYPSGNGQDMRVEYAAGGEPTDVQQVQFFIPFFNPFLFFIPFFLLFALRRRFFI